MDGDIAACAVVSAADTRAVPAVGRNRTAVDGDVAACAAAAAADAGAIFTGIRIRRAVGGDLAAVDGDVAAVAVAAAADARAVAAALGRDRAAIDRDGASRTAVIAADARTVVVAVGHDVAAVDHNAAVVVSGITANGRAAGGMGIDLTVIKGRIRILTVNRKCASHRDIKALHIQGETVAENQVDIAGDGFNAAILRNVAVQVIPAARHVSVRGNRCGIGCFCFRFDRRAVPFVLHIGNADAFLAVRHGNVVRHAVDGDSYPFGSVKRLVRGYDPFACLVERGKQVSIADRNIRDLAGQANRCQNFGQRNGGIALQDVFLLVVIEFDCVFGKAGSLGDDRAVRRVGGQLLGTVRGFMKHAHGQVEVVRLVKLESDRRCRAPGGLNGAALGVRHGDLIGIGSDHGLTLHGLRRGGLHQPARGRGIADDQHRASRKHTRSRISVVENPW